MGGRLDIRRLNGRRGGIAALGLLTLSACGAVGAALRGPTAERTAMTPVRQNSAMTTPVAPDGLPDELRAAEPLWETRQVGTPTRPGSISRLYDDGRLYTWSNTRRRQVNGQLRRETAPYLWRLDAQIRPEGVDQVRELIRTGFQQLPENQSVATGQDQAVVVRRSFVDGAAHTVLFPASATADLPAVVRDIDRAISANVTPGAVPVDQ